MDNTNDKPQELNINEANAEGSIPLPDKSPEATPTLPAQDDIPTAEPPAPDHLTPPAPPIAAATKGKGKSRTTKAIMSFLTFVLLIGAGLGIFYFYSEYTNKVPEETTEINDQFGVVPDSTELTEETNLPEAEEPVYLPLTGGDPIYEDTEITGQKKFTSLNHGLSFLFMEESNDVQVLALEMGTKIYVYYGDLPYDQGQYVEVFSKDPAKTLEEAVQELFLADTDPTACQVTKTTFPEDNNYPASYVGANIGTVKSFDDFGDMGEMWVFIEENCPLPYTASNGISYFLMDTEHPDKFLFFSIGQYGINADSNQNSGKGWQDTIVFTD
jgi:hypothetical protein